MIDRLTVEQKILRARTAFDKINTSLADREAIFQAVLSSTFLDLAAATQVIKKAKSPQAQAQEQLQWINQGFSTVGTILAIQGDPSARYGKGRRCAKITREMAQKAVDLAKKAVDDANILIHRGASCDAILSERLLDFCVASALLQPDKSAQAAMMSMANETVAEVLKSGWLNRNVIKVVG